MKKFQSIRSLIIIVLAAAMFSSCQKDPVENVTPQPSVPSDVQLNPADDPQGESSQERETGVVLLTALEYGKLPKAEESVFTQSLPPVLSFTCPAIANQGSEGSCVAFGTAYAARSIMQRNLSGGSFANNANIYSPEYVYNQIKVNSNCGSGSYVTSAFNLMKNKGVCTWAQMPYSSTNGCSLQPTTKQNNAALLNKITGYSTVTRTTLSIKNQLIAGKPVIVAGPVDVNFQLHGNNQVYSQYNSSQFVGNHCYTVVGYDDSKNAFKVMNSWGTGWGSSGFGWINYTLVNTMFQEAYIINGLL